MSRAGGVGDSTAACLHCGKQTRTTPNREGQQVFYAHGPHGNRCPGSGEVLTPRHWWMHPDTLHAMTRSLPAQPASGWLTREELETHAQLMDIRIVVDPATVYFDVELVVA